MKTDEKNSDAADPLFLETVQAVLTLNRYFVHYWKALHGQQATGRQVTTLRYLADRGASTMGDLASYLFITESSTSELVSKLEKAGLVARNRSSEDNRIVYVSLTGEGTEFAAHVPLGGVPLLREKLSGLPAPELAKIRDAVKSLIDLMEIQDVGNRQ